MKKRRRRAHRIFELSEPDRAKSSTKPGTKTVQIASIKSVAVRNFNAFSFLPIPCYSLRPPLPLRPARYLLPLPPNLPQIPRSPLGLPIESASLSSFRTVSSSFATGSKWRICSPRIGSQWRGTPLSLNSTGLGLHTAGVWWLRDSWHGIRSFW